MSAKAKNTLILSIILFVIILGSGIYSFVIQGGNIKDRQAKVNELKMYELDTQQLLAQLDLLKVRVAQMDSILALRKYNIPSKLPQSSFFDFVNSVSFNFSPLSYVNIEYIDSMVEQNYKHYKFKLTGTALFNDLYKLVYAIEQSKFLKKVLTSNLNNFIQVEEDGTPHFLVNYALDVAVYFADNDRFSAVSSKENRLIPNPIYDIFYPLIRNEIPPNTENLLDVQVAQLLALIPDGAYLADANGNTFLLWEGDPVYLGYLTEIDYQNNRVHFILNKGGIIERITLTLEKEKKSVE
ncbi:MAG: hypothetical protein A2V66_14760 [Ignavibacteria bacterium RBG_13_36_8]|nr:MAG: hypothetical protein A2V66_14760 [Ignavibacteria bacterium RBG_13_36_8]